MLYGLSFRAFSQNQTIVGAGISANIIKPYSLTKTIEPRYSNAAIILIILPDSSGITTSATYYFTSKSGYTYTDPSASSPFIFKDGSSTLKIASFISDPVLSAGSNLIAGVFVSVTPSNVTVNYN